MSITHDLPNVTDLRGPITALLACRDSESINTRAADRRYREVLSRSARTLAERAFSEHQPAALHEIHAVLNDLYKWYFNAPPLEHADSKLDTILDDIRGGLETAVLEDLDRRVDKASLVDIPTEIDLFLPWYRRLINVHRASNHPFYRDYIEKRATAEDIQFYLAQETSIDPRFDDILALLIMGTDGSEKMELVGNLWDELGNGDSADVHTTVFAQTLDDAGVSAAFIAGNIMLESMVCGNVSAALALSKRHYYKAIGYFGVTEYLTPRRFRSFVVGCKRLDLPATTYRYHTMHVEIDARHGPAWFKNVIVPAVAREPRCARDIALGTLLRLETSAWYLDALQATLEGSGPNADGR